MSKKIAPMWLAAAFLFLIAGFVLLLIAAANGEDHLAFAGAVGVAESFGCLAMGRFLR